MVAETLRFLCDANRGLGLYEEGIQQAKEALEIYRRLDDVLGQALSWRELASSLLSDDQLDAAEEATSQSINLLSDKEVDQVELCEAHRILGKIYESKGETGKAINHFETAVGIASAFNWHDILFWNNYDLAQLFSTDDRFRPRLNVPSYIRSMTHINWVARWSCRPTFGSRKAGSRRQSPRPWALSKLMRRSEPRRIWKSAELSSARSKRRRISRWPLTSTHQISTVSSLKYYHSLPC